MTYSIVGVVICVVWVSLIAISVLRAFDAFDYGRRFRGIGYIIFAGLLLALPVITASRP